MRVYHTDRRPKYIQIYDWVHGMIRKGRLGAGDKIPTEPDLARRFNASRMTVRKAIDPLVMEGVLERRPGKGTFVVSSGIINLTCDASKPARFFHLMQKLGVPHRFEVIEKAVVEADPDLCSHLGLAAEKRVIRLTIVLYAYGKPVIVERDYFPYDTFKRLMVLDISDPPLVLLDREFNVKTKNVQQFISAVVAGEEEMSLFKVDDPIPCLYLEWISCSADGRPFSVSLCHYRGDAFKFKIPSCELVQPDEI